MFCTGGERTVQQQHKNIIWKTVCTRQAVHIYEYRRNKFHFHVFSTGWVEAQYNKPNGTSVRYQQRWHHRWFVGSRGKCVYMNENVNLCVRSWCDGGLLLLLLLPPLLLNLYKWMAVQNSTKTLLIVAESSMRSTFKLKCFSTRAGEQYGLGTQDYTGEQHGGWWKGLQASEQILR